MPELHIAKSGAKHAPTLPLDAVTRTFGIVGQRGTGKTSTAVVMVEEMARKGAHCAVLDPVGAWYGITRAGERKGIPGIVIGGEHGDVPLEETAGQLVADLVVGRHWPVVVIDLKLLRKGAQLRFMADFLEVLFHANRAPLHVVFEEADRPLPQSPRGMDPTMGRVLGAGEDIVKLGRSRGLGATLVTQRPATLNKNVLEVCESLILHRLMGPNDRKAVKGWVEANGDERELKLVMDSMASLGLGEAWLYSPGWLKLLERIRVRARHTFDSSATPEVGAQVIEPTERAPVDLDELRERMAETVERAKANDPRELHRRIETLEAELEAARTAAPEPERILVPDREAAVRLTEETARMEALLDELARFETELREREAPLLARIVEHQERMTETHADLVRLLDFAGSLPREGAPSAAPVSAAPVPPAPAVVSPSRRPAPAPNSNGASATGPQQRVLDALAWLRTVGIEPASRLQVAMVAGYHERTKGFTNALGAMNGELVIYPQPGFVQLTDAGAAQANAPGRPLTNDDLHAMIYAQVGGGRARILKPIVERYPGTITRAELAEMLGYHERTKGFTNGLGRLRSLGLIEYPQPGVVEACPVMFVR